jgi:coenzyme F420-dependent glucose-6-phosphate dehydrogenase
MELGYKLCSEERDANQLVRDACLAEDAGFSFAAISDHYHPWLDLQGESPFVWSVLGAIATRTRTLRVGTAVTCPTIRIHPSIVAQAAATAASLFQGRFFLGVGTGENLNEHIVSAGWPAAEVRRSMLEEALGIIRGLWGGELYSHDGEFFSVDRARLYSLPSDPPPIYIAASGREAAKMAGAQGDGLMSTAPDAEVVDAFIDAGGGGKPRIAEMTVCYDEDFRRARETLRTRWPMPAIPGELSQELPLPRHFQQAAELVRDENLSEIVVGPDADLFREGLARFEKAGFDHVVLHQVGHDQEGFMRFAASSLMP